MITIKAQILDGNLGDHWKDNRLAADALAEFARRRWMNDLCQLDFDIKIEIKVQYQTSGASRAGNISMDISGDPDFVVEVESLLTPEHEVWQQFCESPEAEALQIKRAY